MTRVNATNSKIKAVRFLANGGNVNDIMVFALEYNHDTKQYEYWFTIGDGYKTLNGAKRAAVKKMAKHGYTLNQKELDRVTL